jgi:hypothetical protein
MQEDNEESKPCLLKTVRGMKCTKTQGHKEVLYVLRRSIMHLKILSPENFFSVRE